MNTFEKTVIFFLSLFSALSVTVTATHAEESARDIDYDRYFSDERMRIDITFAGDATEQKVFLNGIKKECKWSGSRKNLTDKFGYGEYMLEVFSDRDGKLIYSKGFNTLFQEWRTTAEAEKVRKAFQSSYTIPYPKAPVTIRISERIKSTGKFSELESFPVDPSDLSINMEKGNDFETVSIMQNGDCENKVDILFIAEGYTEEEMDKFIEDAHRFTGYLFEIEPYKSRKDDFNIWAVKSVSKESGTDIPHEGIWKNTAAGSTFYTFYVDRYLTAPNQKIIAEAASSSPYDALYVIVNTEKYGGGGIYNFYGLSMRENHIGGMPLHDKVFVHEFGHSFAGLGDEYYDSEVAYEEFYNLKVEPWEPNLTTLVDFERKWKDMMDPSTPVPTPPDSRFHETTGVFEGGGYMSKGIYRPAYDCRMKTNTAKGFCPVCTRAINDMIDFYIGK